MKKNQKTIVENIKNLLNLVYKQLEKPFTPPKKNLKKLQPEFDSLLKTNNVIKKFYKREELQITDFDNLQNISFKTSDDLLLKGFLYTPNKKSNKWLISCHWFAGYKNYALHYSKIFTKLGWNVLVFDFRNHGDSQKSQTTIVDEYKDLLAAINWLKDNKKIDELALMGVSMGAFVVNYVAVKYAEMLKELNLKLIVSDSPYASIYTLFIHLKRIYLKFSKKTSTKKMVMKYINLLETKNPQTDFLNADIFKLFEQNHKPLAPGLFFHSLSDHITPPNDTYELLIARAKFISNDEHKIYTYARHTQAIRIHFKSYNYVLASFINRISPENNRFKKLLEEWKLLEIDDKNDKKALQLE